MSFSWANEFQLSKWISGIIQVKAKPFSLYITLMNNLNLTQDKMNCSIIQIWIKCLIITEITFQTSTNLNGWAHCTDITKVERHIDIHISKNNLYQFKLPYSRANKCMHINVESDVLGWQFVHFTILVYLSQWSSFHYLSSCTNFKLNFSVLCMHLSALYTVL